MATVSSTKASTLSSPIVQAAGGTLKRSSSKASLTEPKPKRQRTKAGCITCRVRGKVSPLIQTPLFLDLFRFIAPVKRPLRRCQSTRLWALRPRALIRRIIFLLKNMQRCGIIYERCLLTSCVSRFFRNAMSKKWIMAKVVKPANA